MGRQYLGLPICRRAPLEFSPKLLYHTAMGKVVHCKKEKYDIYIGRGSKWGNPFKIGPDGNREDVIKKYEKWLQTQQDLIDALPELRGKVLGCWCSPKPCHGDILEKLSR